MTHTKGPWMAEFEDGSDYLVVGPKTQYGIAKVVKLHCEADAYLIAAAPDLLEMLEAVTDALAGHELNNGDVSAINKARAAIAKATGAA